MCTLCTSHTNMSAADASDALMLEKSNDRGHAYLCQGCLERGFNQYLQPPDLVNGTECPQCGHRVLQASPQGGKNGR